MENTNMHENIHTNNKEITPLLRGLDENCENLMLRKVIQNSFSTFTKILRQLNEKRLPYYLCGGTGSLEELYTMGLSKTVLGGPYAVCPKCREVTSDHIMELVDYKRVTCDKCGGTLVLDGGPTDSIYFWHPISGDVHFEVCVNDEGFKLAHDYIESLIQSLQLSSDELAMTESPTERVLVYRRVTVKCDGTVPNRQYRVHQFPVLHAEMMGFARTDLSYERSVLAPDYAELIEPFSTNSYQIIALQHGDFNIDVDEDSWFFEGVAWLKMNLKFFPVTQEELYDLFRDNVDFDYKAMEIYKWFMSSPHPVSVEDIKNKLWEYGINIYDDYVIIWMSRIVNLKSDYENMDFLAMHYLLSL